MASGGKSKGSGNYAHANLAVLAIVVLGFAGIIYLYYAGSLGVPTQAILALMILFVSGMLIQRLKSFKGGYGFYMPSTLKGAGFIDGLSKRNHTFWKGMAMWGIVMGFGILAYPLLKGKISKKMMVIGIISLLLYMYFIFPCTGLSLQFIKLASLQSAASNAAASCMPHFSGLSTYGYGIFTVVVISGFSGFLIAGLLYNGLNVLTNSVLYALSAYSGAPQSTLLTGLTPGVAPIIPGIDIPLAAGVLSLAIILTIHEFSHGVLARMAKMKIKSIGLLVLGLVPLGAFVEIDEKAVKKLGKEEQNSISAAGISANFIASIVFFLLMFTFFIFIVPNLSQNKGVFIQSVFPNEPANGVLTAGMQILSWNGHHVSNTTQLAAVAVNDTPGSLVTVGTNKGNYTFTAIAINGSTRGYIGITSYQQVVVKPTAYAQAMYFLYTLFALSFILNFLVGIVNLLPVPIFDGYRIYTTNIKTKFFIRFVTGLILISIVLNALPWLFKAILLH